MANFFVPQGADPSIFLMTTDPKGSGSDKPFLHPWKLNLYIKQTVTVGLWAGYNSAGKPLLVTSNATDIADNPSEIPPVPTPDRILSVTGKARGFTMLEARDGQAGVPWCFMQVEVKQQPGSSQGWIGPAGDADFKRKVLRDLETLKKSQSFQKMWDLILRTGYRVTIISGTFNYCTAHILQDTYPLADGTPGNGSSVEIRYNPDSNGMGLEKGNEAWRTAGAPYISLGHELVHVWMMTTGINPQRPGEREKKTTGLPIVDGQFSENQFRRELGLTLRDKYD